MQSLVGWHGSIERFVRVSCYCLNDTVYFPTIDIQILLIFILLVMLFESVIDSAVSEYEASANGMAAQNGLGG